MTTSARLRRRMATATVTPLPRPSWWRLVLGQLGETVVVTLVATLVMYALLYRVAPLPGGGERGLVDFITRYLAWGQGAVRFDFGESPYTYRSVNGLVWHALPRTAGLFGLGLLVVTLGHLFAGWWLVFGRSRVASIVVGTVSAISLVPVYLIAFQVRTGPGGSFMRAGDGASLLTTALLVGTLAALLLLSNGFFAESMTTLSTVLHRESGEPYVRSLVSRRIPRARILLRNTSAVLLGALAGQIPRLLTAVFILEWAFNIHGLGYEALRAFDFEGRRDVPVIMAMTLLSVLMVRVLLLVERLVVLRLNPTLAVKR